ncbi:MAG TPA: hypothetical protein VFM54_21120 [Micromonosporaceae bacterium]|nr:hypothetical protein [Micromonosporaceae bacterium]
MTTSTSPEILFKNDTHKVYVVFDADATVSPARLTSGPRRFADRPDMVAGEPAARSARER